MLHVNTIKNEPNSLCLVSLKEKPLLVLQVIVFVGYATTACLYSSQLDPLVDLSCVEDPLDVVAIVRRSY